MRFRLRRICFDLIRDGCDDRLFNITPEHHLNVKKGFFYMKQKGSWTIEELQRLPIYVRDLYFHEFNEMIKKEKAAASKT